MSALRAEERDHDGLVDVAGDLLHVRRRRGRGPTVVLCSALATVCADWDLVLAALPGIDVVGYDRPGTGHSPPPDPPWPAGPPATLHEEVRRVAHLGPAVGASPPYVVVGHSSGGLIAQAFARLHPELIAGLLLLDSSTAQPAPAPRAAALRHRIRSALARTPLPELTGPGWRRLLVWAQTVHAPDPLPPQDRRRLYGTHGARGVLAELDGFDDAAAALAELERTSPLPRVPVVVLAAARTGRPWRRRNTAALRDQAELARRLGASIFRPVEDSAHLIPLDRADVVAEEIRRLVGEGQDRAAHGEERPWRRGR